MASLPPCWINYNFQYLGDIARHLLFARDEVVTHIAVHDVLEHVSRSGFWTAKLQAPNTVLIQVSQNKWENCLRIQLRLLAAGSDKRRRYSQASEKLACECLRNGSFFVFQVKTSSVLLCAWWVAVLSSWGQASENAKRKHTEFVLPMENGVSWCA